LISGIMKRKLIVSLCILIICAGVMILSNIYKIFLTPLDIGQEIHTDYGDAILILGGGLRPQLVIGFSTEERLNLAVGLYHQKQRSIILSDGSLYRGSPAIKKIKQYLLKRQVDESHIFFEGKSQNTFESCKNSLNIIKKQDFKSIIICTSPYHQKRSQMILNYLGYEDFRIAEMSISEVYRARSIKQRLRNIRLIFRDYVAILKFLLFKK